MVGIPIRSVGTRLLAPVLFLLISSSASAAQFGFECITFNLASDCLIGELQSSVEVTDPGGNQVLFTLTNNGLDAATIIGVYFDDGLLLGLSGLIDADDDALGSFGDPGVDFSPPAVPSELPGSVMASPPFVTTVGFSADADPPAPARGVSPGESLGVVFDLGGGGTFADVINQMNTGAIRVGIMVGFDLSGGSESLVNVPEPSAALLLASALVGLAALRRSR
jgi:hypothetical protein